MSSSGCVCPVEGSNIVRTGYMKKIKTGKRKWFVLRKETPEAQARLEYYDSEKKYQAGVAPRKVILIKSCFNINQFADTKHKYVIALYTKDECFSLALDDEGEAKTWFKDLLLIQQGEHLPKGQMPRPTFEHVWDVILVNRGLGNFDIIGPYRLCMRKKSLTLVRKDNENKQIEINLSSIRSCGSLQKYVFFEVGRSCSLGEGELWLLTEDHNIALNVHSKMYNAMIRNGGNKDELGPTSRVRSSSATESSKTNVKKPFAKGHIFSQDQSQNESSGVQSKTIQIPFVSGIITIFHHLRGSTKSPSERRHSISGLTGRERCESMPSRARTTSEGNHSIPILSAIKAHLTPHRNKDLNSSPPVGSPISPPSLAPSSMAHSIDSAGSSYSLIDENEDVLDDVVGHRHGHSMTPDEPIVEEECDGLLMPYSASPASVSNYMPMTPPRSSDDGYVDMSPIGGVAGNNNNNNNVTPAASLNSVTSGDLKFGEYQCEKGVTYFPNSLDEDARPTRAYSVGSRPETFKYKKQLIEIHGGVAESRRDRAASVGSRSKRGPFRVLPPHGHYPPNHPKSSSAPMLHNGSRVPSSSSSMSSDFGDLMEMDFSNTKRRSNDGYLDMRSNVKTSSGYVEMKPGVIPQNYNAPPSSGPYLDMRAAGTSPSQKNDYLDMNKSRNNDYMDMNKKTGAGVLTNNNYTYSNLSDYANHPQQAPTIRRSFSQLSSGLRNSQSSDYMDMKQGNARPGAKDGYVEMSLGKGHRRQSSLDGVQSRDANRSLPISIVNPKTDRKSSDGNSPKFQLFLNTSSLPRSRKSSSASNPLTPSPAKPDRSFFNTIYRKIRGKNNSSSSQDDYAVMDFGSSPTSDYVKLERPSDYADMSSITDSCRIFKPISESGESKSETKSVGGDEPKTRPDSASSDLCSSSSTLVGSRPDSVNGDTARPVSQLHYANLDLQAIDDDGEGGKSPRTTRTNPAAEGPAQQENFSYAEIDFNKSEELKHTPKP